MLFSDNFMFALHAARVNAWEAVGEVKSKKAIARIHFTPATENPMIVSVPSSIMQVPKVTHLVDACRRLYTSGSLTRPRQPMKSNIRPRTIRIVPSMLFIKILSSEEFCKSQGRNEALQRPGNGNIHIPAPSRAYA